MLQLLNDCPDLLGAMIVIVAGAAAWIAGALK
jgi:hypothetical protein